MSLPMFGSLGGVIVRSAPLIHPPMNVDLVLMLVREKQSGSTQILRKDDQDSFLASTFKSSDVSGQSF